MSQVSPRHSHTTIAQRCLSVWPAFSDYMESALISQECPSTRGTRAPGGHSSEICLQQHHHSSRWDWDPVAHMVTFSLTHLHWSPHHPVSLFPSPTAPQTNSQISHMCSKPCLGVHFQRVNGRQWTLVAKTGVSDLAEEGVPCTDWALGQQDSHRTWSLMSPVGVSHPGTLVTAISKIHVTPKVRTLNCA